MFLLIPDILIFFQFSKIYPSAKITTSKMLRIIEVSPVRWSCAIIFVPQKEVSYFTTLVSRNFLTFTKIQISCVFGYIFISCKYYKKNQIYIVLFELIELCITENVCNYIFIFCFHIFMNHRKLSISDLKCDFWIQKNLDDFFLFSRNKQIFLFFVGSWNDFSHMANIATVNAYYNQVTNTMVVPIG